MCFTQHQYMVENTVMQYSLRGQIYSHTSLVALRGQIMTHPGLCMKYSGWDILYSYMLANHVGNFAGQGSV